MWAYIRPCIQLTRESQIVVLCLCTYFLSDDPELWADLSWETRVTFLDINSSVTEPEFPTETTSQCLSAIQDKVKEQTQDRIQTSKYTLAGLGFWWILTPQQCSWEEFFLVSWLSWDKFFLRLWFCPARHDSAQLILKSGHSEGFHIMHSYALRAPVAGITLPVSIEVTTITNNRFVLIGYTTANLKIKIKNERRQYLIVSIKICPPYIMFCWRSTEWLQNQLHKAVWQRQNKSWCLCVAHSQTLAATSSDVCLQM